MIVVCIKIYNFKLIKSILFSPYDVANFLDFTQIKKSKNSISDQI